MNILDILNIPFSYIIKFCYMIIPNYALALLLFALIIKVVLFPIGIKQQKNSVKQASLTPKVEAIKKRYAGRTDKPTQQKMNEEIMELYKKENFNPAGGCLPMLIQFPILISLYEVIRNPLHYLCNVTNDVIASISSKIVELNASGGLFNISEDMAKKIVASDVAKSQFGFTQIDIISILRNGNIDSLKSVLPEGLSLSSLPDFTIFGGHLDLSIIPSITSISIIIIIPILSMVASFVGMKLTRKFTYQPTATDSSSAASMKMMDFVFPLMSLWIAFTVPAIVALYWIYQNLLNVVQQIVMSKMFPIPVFSEEEMKRIEKEMNGTKTIAKKEKTSNTRSLHHIDDDDEPDSPIPIKKTSSVYGDDDGGTDNENSAKNEETVAKGLIQKAALKDDSGRNQPKEKKTEITDGENKKQ